VTFHLTIETDNAAFGEDDESRAAEVARILFRLAERLALAGQFGTDMTREPVDEGPLLDLNGNTVGRFEFRGDTVERANDFVDGMARALRSWKRELGDFEQPEPDEQETISVRLPPKPRPEHETAADRNVWFWSKGAQPEPRRAGGAPVGGRRVGRSVGAAVGPGASAGPRPVRAKRWAVQPWDDANANPVGNVRRRFWTARGAARWARRQWKHAVIMCLSDERRDFDF